MIALPPLPPAEVRCTRAEKAESVHIKSFIVVSGGNALVRTWLNDATARSAKITEDKREHGKRSATVLLPSKTSYRMIGALIYSGQASGLSVTMKTEPPICGAEAK